jgi:hypothetical protein
MCIYKGKREQGIIVSNTQSNGRRETMTRLEVEKALFTASEMITSTMFTSAFPDHTNEGSLDLWELEYKITQVLTDTANSIAEVAPTIANDLSFEVKRRRAMLIDDMVNLFIECIRDAFGPLIQVEYATPRVITVSASSEIGKKDFIQKEFKSTTYDVLRNLIGK